MEKLGIIGGAGPYASALFYQTMIQESYLQARSVPEILLMNYSFTRGLTTEENERNESLLLDELDYCVQTLERNEVKIGVLVCNTLHLYLRKLAKRSLRFFSLPDLVMEKARENGHYRLLILATQNTCQSDLYQHPHITPLYPSASDQLIVDRVIDHVLEGKIYQSDSLLISQMIQNGAKQMNFDGVVLGCTDLPVLHDRFPIQASQMLYDSVKIPAKILGRIL